MLRRFIKKYEEWANNHNNCQREKHTKRQSYTPFFSQIHFLFMSFLRFDTGSPFFSPNQTFFPLFFHLSIFWNWPCARYFKYYLSNWMGIIFFIFFFFMGTVLNKLFSDFEINLNTNIFRIHCPFGNLYKWISKMQEEMPFGMINIWLVLGIEVELIKCTFFFFGKNGQTCVLNFLLALAKLDPQS